MALLAGHERELMDALPLVAQYRGAFEAQNKRLARTTLTGKISSLNNAATLFEFMEKTQQNFAELQGRLVGHLLEESLKKAVLEAQSRAQAAIDILIRNLYERTADVGFLATDEELLAFLKLPSPSAEERALIHNRLNEYARKYTVYREILLLRPDGLVAARLDPKNPVTKSCDPLIAEACPKAGYLEVFRESDLMPREGRVLIYAGRMMDGNKAAGVLALVFDFEGELRRIFEALGGTIALVDERNRVIASSRNDLLAVEERFGSLADKPYALIKLGGSTHVAVGVKTQGYEGFFGLPWSAHAFVRPEGEGAKGKREIDGRYTALLPGALRQIVNQSEEISEDLGDVVINGELIASKTRAYALNPILENIRAIGDQTRSIFVQTLGDLEQTVAASLFSETALLAKLSLDIMDRNLYERANDCRWWALTGRFKNRDWNEAGDVLAYINGLYTVYALIYLYDAQGTVTAVSKREAAGLVGQKTEDDILRRVLNNTDAQAYFVSPFAATPLYGGKATYVYHASIVGFETPVKTVGGIGIVFDAAPQFEAILRDTLPRSAEGGPLAGAFNLFCDDKNRVIAATHPELKPLDDLPFNAAALKPGESSLFEWREKSYIVATAVSKGYREYKNGDGYTNAVRSFTFVPV